MRKYNGVTGMYMYIYIYITNTQLYYLHPLISASNRGLYN